MATKFKKDQVLRVKTVVPQGPVQSMHMDSNGNFFYLINWVDADGNAQERWFPEDALEAGE
jgi:hypothetical protein